MEKIFSNISNFNEQEKVNKEKRLIGVISVVMLKFARSYEHCPNYLFSRASQFTKVIRDIRVTLLRKLC